MLTCKNCFAGMVPKTCLDLPDLDVNGNMNKSVVMEQLSHTETPDTGTAGVIKYMRKVSHFVACCLRVVS